MTFVQRVNPDASAECVLSFQEWSVLHAKYSKSAAPPQGPPTVREVFTWVARLGGYLNRNSDGPPGTTSIWKGWSRLQDMVLGNNIHHNPGTKIPKSKSINSRAYEEFLETTLTETNGF